MLLSLHDNQQIMIFDKIGYEVIIDEMNRLRDQRSCCFLRSPLNCSLDQDNLNHERYKLVINKSLIVIKQSSLLQLKETLLEASVYLLSRRRLPITRLV